MATQQCFDNTFIVVGVILSTDPFYGFNGMDLKVTGISNSLIYLVDWNWSYCIKLENVVLFSKC